VRNEAVIVPGMVCCCACHWWIVAVEPMCALLGAACVTSMSIHGRLPRCPCFKLCLLHSRPEPIKLCACVWLCCRYDQLLTLVHSVNGASLLVGGPGTAKTTVINQFLGKFNSEVRRAQMPRHEQLPAVSTLLDGMSHIAQLGNCSKPVHVEHLGHRED
jgi:hypothetical protein